MDAKELRVGNYVIHHHNIGMDLFAQIECGNDIDMYKDFSPIPLNEEWKEKLKNTPLFMDKIGFVIFKNGYTYSFIWEDYPFLHQLQNLYFTISGEELI
jgi:hypothetical protein